MELRAAHVLVDIEGPTKHGNRRLFQELVQQIMKGALWNLLNHSGSSGGNLSSGLSPDASNYIRPRSRQQQGRPGRQRHEQGEHRRPRSSERSRLPCRSAGLRCYSRTATWQEMPQRLSHSRLQRPRRVAQTTATVAWTAARHLRSTRPTAATTASVVRYLVLRGGVRVRSCRPTRLNPTSMALLQAQAFL